MRSDFSFRRIPGKQNGVSYVYLFCSFLLLLVAGAFFAEHIVVFKKEPSVFMNNSEFYCSFGMVLFAIASFLFIVHRNFKIGIRWGWLLLFLTLFICNCVGLFSLESVVDLGIYGIYEFTIVDRIQYMLMFGVSCVYFYILFAIAPKVFHNVRILHILPYLIFILNLAALIYSFAMEGHLWITAFIPKAEWRVDEICSFTNNSNQFAIFPIFGVMSVILLHNRRSHWWWYIVLFALGIVELFISSGSGIFATWAMIFIFVFYRFGVTLKYHTGAACLWLFIFFVAMGVILIFMFTGCGGEDFILTRMGNMLKNVQAHTTEGNGRFPIWNEIFHELNTPIRLIFGVGDTQSYFYLNLMMRPERAGELWWAHNGVFQTLYNGGLVRLAILFFVIIRHVYLCVLHLKDKSRVATVSLICCVGLFIRAMIETNSFLCCNGNDFTFFVLIQLPVEIIHFKSKHPEVAQYEQAAKADLKKVRYVYEYSPLRMAKVTFMILGPIAAIFLGAFPHFFRAGAFPGLNQWPFYFLISETLLLAPFAMYCIGYHTNRFDRKIFGFLSLFGMLLATMIGLFFVVGNPIVSYVCMGIIGFIALVCFLCHVKSFFEFREKLFLHAYLPHLLVVGSLAGLSSLGFLVPKEQFSGFVPFMISIMIFSIYMCVYYSKPGEDLVTPLCFKMRHVDSRCTAKRVIAEEAMTAAQDNYLLAGHTYVRPKKTLKEWIV